MSVAVVDPTETSESRPPSMVERMTLIMDCFDGSNSRILLEEISRRTGLPRSTAHRILEQLIRLHWVEHTRAGYRLGRRVISWGARESVHADLRAAASPLLHDMAQKTDLVVHLAVLDGTEVKYLDKIGRHAPMIDSRVGGRSPAHCTSLGKAILASMPAEDVDDLYADGFDRRTASSIGDLATLHSELNRVRQSKGIAFERGECVDGLACIGVAVVGPDGPVGAISLVGRPDTPLDRVAPLLVGAARRIAQELYGEVRGAGRSRSPRLTVTN